MMTVFGDYRLAYLKVWTEPVDDTLPQGALDELLQTRPATEALVLEHTSGRLGV